MAGYALSPGTPPGAVTQSGGTARVALPPVKAAPAKAPAKAAVATQPTLQQQAATLANQQIAAQVAAIQTQQQQAEQQAKVQAQQISLASLAAAHMLSGLGTPTMDAYTQAAQTLAGLAGGYSGQLQTDAGVQAAKVQNDLASVGSQQQASNASPQLANVLYGMRGAQPASVLLNSGAAAAAAANAAPEQILGYGQQVGEGVIGAGLQTANGLIPNILQARAQAPSLVAQYISSLTDSADKQQALANSTAAINSEITSRNNTTKINVAKLGISQQNANTTAARTNAYIKSLTNSQSIKEYNAQTSRISANIRQYLAQHPKPTSAGLKQDNTWQGLAASFAANARQGFATTDKAPAVGANGVEYPVSQTPRAGGWATPLLAADGKTVIGYINHHPPLSFAQATVEATKTGNPYSLAAVNQAYKAEIAAGRRAKATKAAAAKANKAAKGGKDSSGLGLQVTPP